MIYLVLDGKQAGPFTVEQIEIALQKKEITPSTPSWTDGLQDWVPLAEILKTFGRGIGPVASPARFQSGASAQGPADRFAGARHQSTGARHQPNFGAKYARSSAAPMSYGTFWPRLGAHLCDMLILVVVAQVFLKPPPGASPKRLLMFGLLNMALVAAYFILCESSSFQATPGKYLFKLKVTDLDGNRITPLRGLGRYAAKFLSYFTLYIGFVMAAFSEKRQALHDKLANTVVIKRD